MNDTQNKCCFKALEVYSTSEHMICQFMQEPDVARKLVEVSGLTFCPYHLPYASKDLVEHHNVEAPISSSLLKENWSEEDVSTFNKDIHKRVDNALKSGVECDLSGTVFPDRIDFSDKAMPFISLAYAHFPQHALFHKTTFTQGAVFDCARFSSIAFFAEAQFCDRASFDEARFSWNVSFADAHFSSSATFWNTQFLKNAVFRNTRFSSTTNFREASFYGAALFDTWPGSIDPTSYHKNFSDITFDKAHFASRAKFTNRDFLNSLDLWNTTFEQAPEFYGCTLHQDTVFPPIENFKDIRGYDAVSAYQTLGVIAKQHGRHEEEEMFWLLEQRSKRNTLDLRSPKNWFPWCLSWVYEALSCYGVSETRPLLWLTAWLTVITPIVYFQLSRSNDGVEDPIGWSELFGFSLAQSVLPFFLWNDHDGSSTRSVLGENVDVLSVKLFATADSLISLVLIALLILAVRRRFRMQ